MTRPVRIELPTADDLAGLAEHLSAAGLEVRRGDGGGNVLSVSVRAAVEGHAPAVVWERLREWLLQTDSPPVPAYVSDYRIVLAEPAG